MNKSFKIIAIILTCYAQLSIAKTSISNIITVNDFKIIDTEIQKAKHDTLVIFDIGDVFLMSEYAIFRSKNRIILNKYIEELNDKYSSSQLNELWSIMMLTMKPKLIDPESIQLLNKIKKLNVNSIGLTDCGTGEFGKIKSFEDWSFNILDSFGIKFNPSILLPLNLTFHDLQAKYGIPMYKQGVLFTGETDKGEVLDAFLRDSNLHPKKLIFIDNEENNIKSVAKILMNRNINFLGVIYKGASSVPTPDVDPGIFDLQFKILQDEREWLSDLEASSLLYNG